MFASTTSGNRPFFFFIATVMLPITLAFARLTSILVHFPAESVSCWSPMLSSLSVPSASVGENISKCNVSYLRSTGLNFPPKAAVTSLLLTDMVSRANTGFTSILFSLTIACCCEVLPLTGV